MNPGAFTHYSYGIRDAIAGAAVPTIEFIYPISIIGSFESLCYGPACVGQISGFGYVSYLLALEAIAGQRKVQKG